MPVKMEFSVPLPIGKFKSSDLQKILNPECLQWNVTGTDKENIKYVLCQETKDKDDAFITYRCVWSTLERNKITGSSFVFDSNNIEGNWKAFLKIVQNQT